MGIMMQNKKETTPSGISSFHKARKRESERERKKNRVGREVEMSREER
jgi:hypothetical protein